MTDTSQLVDPKQESIYTFHFRHSNKHVDLTEEELDRFPYLIALVAHKNDFLSIENENGEYVLSHPIEYPWFISILRSIRSEHPYKLFNELSEDNNVLDTFQLFDYLGINPFPLPLLKYEELIRSNPTNTDNDEKHLEYHQANLSEARQTAAEFIIALTKDEYDLHMTGSSNTNTNVPGKIVPDGGWGWVIVFSSFMIHFIMDGITYAMAEIYLEPMLEKFQLNRGYVSAIFSILPAVTLGAGPIATVFTNMYGCRIVTIVGACLASLGFFLSRWWVNIYYYYITIGITGGIGFGLIYAPALISVGYYFERKRSLAVGIAIPLPQEHSEQRRAQLRLRKEAKQQAARVVEQAANTDEQQTKLLTNRERLDNVPIQEGNVTLSVSDNVDQNKQSGVSDSQFQKLLSEHNVSSTLCDESNEKRSLDHIPLFNDDINEYHRQIITTLDGTNQPAHTTDDVNLKSIPNRSHVKVKSFVSQVKDQFDLKLLADAAFVLFTISNFLTSLGFNVPYNFAHDLAKDAKVTESHREYVIMSIGLSNAVGRIIIGYLGDRKKINRLFLYNSTLIMAGLATVIAPYCNSNVLTHIIYASIFGFFSGGYVGLTTIIITDLVGIDKLSSALGIVLLCQGIAVAIGTPITGGMRDAFEKHSRPFLWPYFTFGSFIVISGVILFGIPLLKRRQQCRQHLTRNELDMGVVSYSDGNSISQEQQQQQL
ncbi:unnamed protein product [Rotaria sordida]|uniref:Major facilitator superfamily (MFS) profile domain-containing protein n=1 Tax=Rotaria sordida TaxID=392033 RepID=A0A819K470_9BILA|nr:unnamed protein product [Rotaria sordida]